MIMRIYNAESIIVCLGLVIIAASIIRCVVNICIINYKHKIWERENEERHSIGGKANDKS